MFTKRVVLVEPLRRDREGHIVDWHVRFADVRWFWGWPKSFRCSNELRRVGDDLDWYNTPVKVTYHYKRWFGNIIDSIEKA